MLCCVRRHGPKLLMSGNEGSIEHRVASMPASRYAGYVYSNMDFVNR